MNKGAQGCPLPRQRRCELCLYEELIQACPLWVSPQHSHWGAGPSSLPLLGTWQGHKHWLLSLACC